MGDLSFSLDDTLILSDNLKLGLGLRLSDNQVLLDSIAISTIRPGREVEDSLNLTDNLILSARYLLPLSDTLTLLDSIQIRRDSVLSDTISLTDAISIAISPVFLALAVSLDDRLSLSDSIEFFQLPNRISLSDSLVLEDSIRVNLRETDLAYLRRYLNDF